MKGLGLVRTEVPVWTESMNTLANVRRNFLASSARHLQWLVYCTRKLRLANNTIARMVFVFNHKD